LAKAKYRNFDLIEFMGKNQSKRQEKKRGPEYQGKFIKEMKVEELKNALKSFNLSDEGIYTYLKLIHLYVTNI
jgi:hypothetical protein